MTIRLMLLTWVGGSDRVGDGRQERSGATNAMAPTSAKDELAEDFSQKKEKVEKLRAQGRHVDRCWPSHDSIACAVGWKRNAEEEAGYGAEAETGEVDAKFWPANESADHWIGDLDWRLGPKIQEGDSPRPQ